MNNDILEGNWKQVKGKVKERWGELTDGHLEQIKGKVTRLVGLIQEHYGISREKAEQQVEDWLKRIDGEDPEEDPGSATVRSDRNPSGAGDEVA